MRKILLKDIVIPAGTIFEEAPLKSVRSEGHIGTVIGLTKDSFGDLTYYFDKDDPELDKWFGEEGTGFEIKNNNLIVLGGVTKTDIPPERVLEQAKGKLKNVLVLGIENGNKNTFYFCSNTSDQERALWIAQNFINQLLNGFQNWVDEEDKDES